MPLSAGISGSTSVPKVSRKDRFWLNPQATRFRSRRHVRGLPLLGTPVAIASTVSAKPPPLPPESA
eukprot:6042240-Pyramimonas_sp.AAC.1